MKEDKSWFLGQLRRAMAHLYDPEFLRTSPLTELLDVRDKNGLGSGLRRTLIGAVDTLKESRDLRQGSRAWRTYQILRRRYVEQATQREVAADLGLSVRQLQREEKLANEVLADFLLTAHGLETRVGRSPLELPPSNGDLTFVGSRIPSQLQELEQLQHTSSTRQADLAELIRGVVRTLSPLIQSTNASVSFREPPRTYQLIVHVEMLRLALLEIVGAGIQSFPGCNIRIELEISSANAVISVVAMTNHLAAYSWCDLLEQSFEVAGRLIRFSGGSLEFGETSSEGASGYTSKLTIPARREQIVLVVDDNPDTLQLYRRYLSGSRYRLVGAEGAKQGLELSRALSPHVIVLDVMMPETDGWQLLEQILEQPETRDVPVLICSVLSQENLAFSLGAREFLRKPITRSELLSALDRQMAQPGETPG